MDINFQIISITGMRITDSNIEQNIINFGLIHLIATISKEEL